MECGINSLYICTESAEAILKVKISELRSSDSLFWPLEASGIYSVKSAHSALVKQRCTDISSIRAPLWKDLWKLHVHDRLKLLLWKVIWDILPTKVKVAGRIGECDMEDESLFCGSCGECLETLQHLILLCPYNRAVWCESPWQLNSADYGEGELPDWLKVILHPHLYA